MAYLLRKIFGLKSATNIQVMNKVKTTDHSVVSKYFEDIPTADVEKLREKYKYDFLLFNYTTGVPVRTSWLKASGFQNFPSG